MREGWEVKKLGECAITSAGGTPLKSNKKYYDEGNIPWLLSGEVSQGEIFQSKKFITELGLTNSSAKLFPINSVLVAMYGATAGQVGILRFEASTNQAVCAIFPNINFISEYMYYFFLSKKSKLLSQAIGNAQPNISQTKIKEIIIPIPPLPEQKEIVAILDKAFAVIDQAKANIEKNIINAKELFQSKLNEIFSQKGDGWEERSLGEVCEKFQYGSSTKSLDEGAVPVLRMGNIQNGKIVWDKLKYSNNREENEKFLLKKNNILFNRTNSAELVGKTAIFKEDIIAIFAGYLIRIELDRKVLNADYLNFYLNSREIRNYGFSVMCSSVNQANINASKLKAYKIRIPSIIKQDQIAQELLIYQDMLIELNLSYCNKKDSLEELKKSILQKAFTGELTQKDAVL